MLKYSKITVWSIQFVLKKEEMGKSKHWNNSLFCLWKIARAFFFLDVGFIFLHFFLLVIWVCLFHFWKKATPYHKFLTQTSKTSNSKFKSFVYFLIGQTQPFKTSQSGKVRKENYSSIGEKHFLWHFFSEKGQL